MRKSRNILTCYDSVCHQVNPAVGGRTRIPVGDLLCELGVVLGHEVMQPCQFGFRCSGIWNNLVGQIGDGTNDDRQRPTIVNSFTANVSPAAALAIGGRFANVTALINCPADGMAHVSLTLSQGAVSGYGTALVDCAGGLIRAPISIAAHGAQVFQPGSATADVESLVRERGVITEDQHWSRTVILQ